MDNLALSIISAILIGLGATFTMDLWALFLKRTFKIAIAQLLSSWAMDFDTCQKEFSHDRSPELSILKQYTLYGSCEILLS